MRAGAQFAPLAFFGPACCMVAGAVLLNRMVRPVADIEQQLFQVATSPSVESCELREVSRRRARRRMGWNRVVQAAVRTRSAAESLQQRFGNRSTKAGKAGSMPCSTACPMASRRPTPTAG